MASNIEKILRAAAATLFVVSMVGAISWWLVASFSWFGLPIWASVPLFLAPFVLMVTLIQSFADPY